MKPYLKYFLYVLKHKWFVFLAGLKVGASLWLLLIHDWSKFRPSEFFPYADNFFNNQKQKGEYIDVFGDYGIAEAAPFGYFAKDRFRKAWLLHQRRNKHHWNYWVSIDPFMPIPMPEKYIREMVADWAGAGKAITGRWEVKEWYEKNAYKINLHPETETFVFNLLPEFDALESR